MDAIKLAVKIMNYAEAHYADGKGWDVVVECNEIPEIKDELVEMGIKSVKEYYDRVVAPYHEYAMEIASSAY